MPTLQNLIDSARISLNDDTKDRWSDSDMLSYAQDGLAAIFNLRPDLFIGQFSSFDVYGLTLASDFPIPAPDGNRFCVDLKDYMIFAAHQKDSEWSDDGKSMNAFTFFAKRLAS